MLNPLNDKAMKRRILMVSAMILLIGSQMQMNARKKGGPDFKRPGMEIRNDRMPGRPMNVKAICQGDIERLQDYYWKKYRVRLSKNEAEKILLVEKRDRDRRDFAHNPPVPPKGKKPAPKGPQRPR